MIINPYWYAVAGQSTLAFLENIPRHDLTNAVGIAGSSVSFCPITASLSLPLGNAYFGWRNTASTTYSFNFSVGLYSLNGSTLSRFNQFSRSFSFTGSTAATTFQTWLSMIVSQASTMLPGQYWLGLYFNPNHAQSKFGIQAAGSESLGYTGSNPAYARMSVTTSAMPVSVATSDLTSFSEGTKIPYVLLTS